MDPVSIIADAAVAGATAVFKDTAGQAVKDAYAGLKRLIIDRYRSASIELVEQDPTSQGRELVLKEDLQKADADKDEELLRRAQAVLDAIEQQPVEQTAALGVDLEWVKAANVRVKEIIAAGTGFRARNVETSGDIDLVSVRAGVDGQKNGQRWRYCDVARRRFPIPRRQRRRPY
jgi:hypothetical protein